jgi:pilus assembly protein Flp/PilA
MGRERGGSNIGVKSGWLLSTRKAGSYYPCNVRIDGTYRDQKETNEMRAKIEQLKKKGQGLVEYALILVLIAIVVIVILTFLGNQVNNTFSRIGSAVNTP